MLPSRRHVLHLAVGGVLASARLAAAQSYPERPIRLVVPFPPGGAYDGLGRPWADRIKPLLGTVVVENIGGAGASLGAAAVARARPDGYTLLLDPHSSSAMLFAVESDVPFKMDGKTPIALLTLDPVVYSVKADSPWKRYGIAGVSGVAAFFLSQFLYAAGVPIAETNRVVFTGGRRPSPRWPAATWTSAVGS